MIIKLLDTAMVGELGHDVGRAKVTVLHAFMDPIEVGLGTQGRAEAAQHAWQAAGRQLAAQQPHVAT